MTYKIGDVFQTLDEARQAFAAKHYLKFGILVYRLNNNLKFVYWDEKTNEWFLSSGPRANDGPWTIVTDPSKPAKPVEPERKQLSFDEARVAKKVSVEVPDAHTPRIFMRGEGWLTCELNLFDLAERRGWPIYAVEGE